MSERKNYQQNERQNPKQPRGALALLHAWADVGDEKIDALIDEIYAEREKDRGRPVELED